MMMRRNVTALCRPKIQVDPLALTQLQSHVSTSAEPTQARSVLLHCELSRCTTTLSIASLMRELAGLAARLEILRFGECWPRFRHSTIFTLSGLG
jgi:hypothetical protein